MKIAIKESKLEQLIYDYITIVIGNGHEKICKQLTRLNLFSISYDDRPYLLFYKVKPKQYDLQLTNHFLSKLEEMFGKIDRNNYATFCQAAKRWAEDHLDIDIINVF